MFIPEFRVFFLPRAGGLKTNYGAGACTGIAHHIRGMPTTAPCPRDRGRQRGFGRRTIGGWFRLPALIAGGSWCYSNVNSKPGIAPRVFAC